MSFYNYYQRDGGDETWKAIPDSFKEKVLKEENPTFITVLGVSKLVEELSYEDKLKLAYTGPFYVDFDGPDIDLVAEKAASFLDKLEGLKVDPDMLYIYATGKKGFHIEIPQELFMEKIPGKGVELLPTIYKEMALDLYVDTLDLRVYSQGRGRMWRVPNKQRDNGLHKVRLTASEFRAITVDSYNTLCSTPRHLGAAKAPELCLELSLAYTRASQRVADKIKKRGKIKADPNARLRASSPSIGLLMGGLGIKPGTGFQQISTQLAIAAVTAGTSLEDFLVQCEGLINTHEGDGSRYNSVGKRKAELERMYLYMSDNPCYEFSVGAIKVLLNHEAPDLDGISVDKEDLIEGVKEADTQSGDGAPDEYADVAGGVTLSKYGIYVDSEFGKKRVCAISFKDTTLLMSMETGTITAYDSIVLVNGKDCGRQTLETDVFSTSLHFNRFCARLGHAYAGTDMQLRGVFMRFVEQAKKSGNMRYITKREGLDVVSIPNHDNPEFRKPFVIWADGRGVIPEPRIRELGLQLSFVGFPDPRGTFMTDIGDAPSLKAWLEEPESKPLLMKTLQNLLTCQTPTYLGSTLGWYVASFWRMLFHRAYGQFPLLHVAGGAGGGKSQMQMLFMSLFYYNIDARTSSPTSTPFALQQTMSGSSSIPLVLDEYKPHEMSKEYYNKIKLMLRDAYNCRDVARGGGTRDSEDYRSLNHFELSAPIAFIAEATEDEAAIMERVVLVTSVRPPSEVNAARAARFQAARSNKFVLSIIGQYIASMIVNTYSVESLREEFQPMYAEAVKRFMFTADDLGVELTEAQREEKRNGKDRTIFNYTVAKFGMMKFREIISHALDGALDEKLLELEGSVYSRMNDLQKATQPEFLKVLSMMSTMSYAVEADRPEAIRSGIEYAHVNYGGKSAIEISARTAYIKYRMYCRASGTPPLFPGHESFCSALKDASCLLKQGFGDVIKSPGVYVLDSQELAKLEVEPFKG